MLTNCYDILNVQQSCDNKELRKAYYRLAKMTHPDKLKDFVQDDESAKKIGPRAFRRVTDAYNYIVNQRKKKALLMKKAVHTTFIEQMKDCHIFEKSSQTIQQFMKFDDMPSYSYSKHLDILNTLKSRLDAMKTTSFQKMSKNSKFSDEEFYLF